MALATAGDMLLTSANVLAVALGRKARSPLLPPEDKAKFRSALSLAVTASNSLFSSTST